MAAVCLFICSSHTTSYVVGGNTFCFTYTPASFYLLELPPQCGLPPELHTSPLVWLHTAVGAFPVHICHCLGGNLFFKCGWSEFVRRHAIQPGDVIFLEYLGSSNFRVFSYAPPLFVLRDFSDVANATPVSDPNMPNVRF